MDFEERLTTLLHLFADISQKIVHELRTTNDPKKISEYNKQLQDIDIEVKRIQALRSQKTR